MYEEPSQRSHRGMFFRCSGLILFGPGAVRFFTDEMACRKREPVVQHIYPPLFRMTEGGHQPEPYWCTRVSELPDAAPLSSSQRLFSVDFRDVNDLHRFINGVSGVLKIRTTSDGTIHAVSVHFKALIWGDQYLDTSESTCWEQGIFPLPYPMRVNQGETVILNWMLKGTRLDLAVDSSTNSERDYRTMNNDMLLYAITRIIPSVSRYSWNLDIDLSEEEASVVRNLPHFMVDLKDIDETLDVNMDESKSQCDANLCIIVWPIRADGSVSEVFLNSLQSLRSRNDIPPSLKHCGFLTGIYLNSIVTRCHGD
ncbi:unnamed protein product [Angiostrongylus costaricensis]|uniref:Mab-21 domain-containing protein n=1 Tax=Angiostrongylus costaricensis TaxID=334426 RepID=A0A0R3P9V5_ANGCS|nr:unnamed protein product [Angiostrongylus costaricensis]